MRYYILYIIHFRLHNYIIIKYCVWFINFYIATICCPLFAQITSLWIAQFTWMHAHTHARTHTHTHTQTTVLRPSWILSGTTRVSRHQKGKTRKVKPIWIYWSNRQWVAIHLKVVYYTCLTAFFSKTTWVSRYQKGRTIVDSNDARDEGSLLRNNLPVTSNKSVQ